jgi:hypothetical protein
MNLKRIILAESKGDAISVTGRGGAYACETSRLPHFLDSQLTDGGEVVSLTRQPLFTRQEDSWYSFQLEGLSFFFFLNSNSGRWSPYWVHSARRPLVAYCICQRLTA